MRNVLKGFTAVFFFVSLAAVVILANRRVQSENIEASIPTVAPSPSRLSGTIEGSISYPSEAIPEDLRICAETLQGQTIACTDKKINDPKYTYGVGYRLEIIPGEYYIYATVPSLSDYKAYYNEFVTCGLSVNCPSHKKIIVSVDSGETIKKIDPQDWYDQPKSSQ